jgi:tetratricopeptide (TPR) repeat protein/GTPase SAR1 family protein
MSLWQRVQRRIGDLAGELVLDEYRDQLNHAQQLLVTGDTSAAIDVLEALLVAKPEHGQALILLGEARLVTRDPERAREAFERAIKQRSGDPEALVGHGTALVQLGKYETAIHVLGRAVAESGGDRAVLADAYRGLGIAWRRRGDLDKAIRELRKAVTEDGDDPEARASLGEAIVADSGSLDEALRHLERAAKEKSPPALALYGLARLALLENAPAIAREHLAKSRAIAEQDPTPLGRQRRLDIVIAQGDAALADRDAMAAHSFFLEGLQENPRLAILHARVAAAHRMIGNLDAALASYDRALALGADNEVMRAAIDTAIAADDTTRALQWGNDLLGQDPNDVRAIVARGIAMMATQPDAARALLEIAAARDDIDAHVALAKLALPTDPAKAATSALAALRVDPHNARARSLLTDARARHLGAPSNDIADIARFVERVFESRRELGHLVGEVARSAANLDQPLLVTVMGEFKSGKSSFVNAFIGAEVAPTGITPTTATINVVRYGRERAGRIYGHDGTCTEMGWDELTAYLQQLSAEDSRKIDRVEMLVPLPQLEKINIVDTPGLNSILPEHEATALGFIAKADAIVWVFSAGQSGKASEKKALLQIREEGKRVLGVLNKADQLNEPDLAEVLTFVGHEIGDLVETVVPFSARKALAWKKTEQGEDGNWGALYGALEERFFQQARQLKRDGCARVLRGVIGDAQHTIDAIRQRSVDASEAARVGRDGLLASSRQFTQSGVLAERKSLSDVTSTLYRRAAREVLDLVRPRRLPFSSHTATAADRDYLIALLQSGFESAIESGRRRVADDLLARSRGAEIAARTLAAALHTDVVGDLQRAAEDRIGLALSRVFDRARAYLRGYLEGGYVEAFFRNDVPRLELAEDSVYHALVRAAPDLDREIGEPLARAVSDALAALAKRLEHWGAVADVHAFDLEVGIGRALEIAASRVSP